MAKKEETKVEKEKVAVEKKYEVIQDFKDLQDGNKVYFIGDRYPKPANKIVDEERLEQLLSKDNRQNRAVIKEIN